MPAYISKGVGASENHKRDPLICLCNGMKLGSILNLSSNISTIPLEICSLESVLSIQELMWQRSKIPPGILGYLTFHIPYEMVWK